MFPKEWHTYSYQQPNNYRENTGGVLHSPEVYGCSSLIITPKRTVFSFVHNHHINLCIIDYETKDFRFGVPWPNKYYWNIFGSSPVYMTDEYMVNFTEASSIVSYRE